MGNKTGTFIIFSIMDGDVEDDTAEFLPATLVKRKRLEAPASKTNIDVPRIIGNDNATNSNRFAILGDLEIENDNVATKSSPVPEPDSRMP